MEGEHYLYFPKEGVIRRVDKGVFGKALGFFLLVEDSEQNGCNISRNDLPIVLEELLPELEKAIPVKMQTALEVFIPDTPEFQFYLDMPQRDLIVCKGYAVYGEERYSIFFRLGSVRRRDGEAELERRAKGREQAWLPFSVPTTGRRARWLWTGKKPAMSFWQRSFLT